MTISIELENELESRIQRIADTRHRSLNWIVREAICEYAEREEAMEQFEQEALASWENYEETGQHLTGQEIRNWLDTWGTDNETVVPPMPQVTTTENTTQLTLHIELATYAHGPQVIITENAAQGLERCRRLLAKEKPQAARHAAQAIRWQFMFLQTNPGIGRPLTRHPQLSELVIGIEDFGYIALYHYELEHYMVYVLAFRQYMLSFRNKNESWT